VDEVLVGGDGGSKYRVLEFAPAQPVIAVLDIEMLEDAFCVGYRELGVYLLPVFQAKKG
jgi:hypothetical protein